MNCEECREELAAYLEGLLDEASRSRIESHLAECSACRAELQEVRQLTAQLARDGLGDCPDFRVSENGTVPFGPRLDCSDTKTFTGPCTANESRPTIGRPKKGPNTVTGRFIIQANINNVTQSSRVRCPVST